MELRALRVEPLRLALRAPLNTARGALHIREGFLLALEDASGRCGLGEAMPLESFGTESPRRCEEVLAEVGRRVRGHALPESLEGLEAFLGGLEAAPSARHGLEVALLDLLGQRLGAPVWKLLGATSPSSVTVNALLSDADVARQARLARERGFGTVKLKVGRELARNVELVAVVREAVGPGVRIRIDPNGCWTERAAVEALGTLGRFDLELCEQPVAAADFEALKRVRQQVPVPLAADEALALPGAAAAFANGGIDALVLKPMVLGGLVPALELARKLGVAAYVTSSIDGPVARTAALHLAAALPNAPFAHGLATGELLSEPDPAALQPHEGRIRLPEGAGLGFSP